MAWRVWNGLQHCLRLQCVCGHRNCAWLFVGCGRRPVILEVGWIRLLRKRVTAVAHHEGSCTRSPRNVISEDNTSIPRFESYALLYQFQVSNVRISSMPCEVCTPLMPSWMSLRYAAQNLTVPLAATHDRSSPNPKCVIAKSHHPLPVSLRSNFESNMR